MEITYSTPISALINVGEVSSKTSEIESLLTQYTERTDGCIREEITSNLSADTFYINNESIFFDKMEQVYSKVSSLDTSALSNILSLAQKKRQEELLELKAAVSSRISYLQASIDYNNYQIAAINATGGDSSGYSEANRALNNEKRELEEKLRTIESELGGS